MTDLTDRDALREKFVLGTDGWMQKVSLAVLKAAPTVSCEECVFIPARDVAAICRGCFCGSNFERRQP